LTHGREGSTIVVTVTRGVVKTWEFLTFGKSKIVGRENMKKHQAICILGFKCGHTYKWIYSVREFTPTQVLKRLLASEEKYCNECEKFMRTMAEIREVV
jgi:hypothetical protein